MTEGLRWQITKAVRASALTTPARVIMLVLADVAEVGTAEIPAQRTPSLAVLAQETALGRSTVQRYLNELEAAGWLARTRPAQSQQWAGERVRYRLCLPAGVAPEREVVAPERDMGAPQGDGVAPEREGVAPQRGPSTDNTRDKTKNSPSESSTRARGTRIPAAFDLTDDLRRYAVRFAADALGREPNGRFGTWLDRKHLDFVDYWNERSGSQAVKRDWGRAWQRWMRREIERSAEQTAGTAVAQREHVPEQSPGTIRATAAVEIANRLKRQREEAERDTG